MQRLKIHNSIYVKKSNIHGYGVFTDLDIKKGELIEECVVPYQIISLHSDVLINYRYVWAKRRGDTPIGFCIALGFGSIYNHSKEENIGWEINEKERIITFTAIKDIKKNEELLFDYENADPLASSLSRLELMPKKELPKFLNKVKHISEL